MCMLADSPYQITRIILIPPLPARQVFCPGSPHPHIAPLVGAVELVTTPMVHRGGVHPGIHPGLPAAQTRIRAVLELPSPPSTGASTLQLVLALRQMDPDASGGDEEGVCYVPISPEHLLHVSCR
jgi:hypothetical protein